MSHWTAKLLDESTVVWSPPVRDGLGGYTWAAPEQLNGRWQYLSGSSGPKLKYDMKGTLINASTVVWINREIELGSYLWKGTVAAIPPETDIMAEASQVIAITNVRSIPTGIYLYKAHLDES